MSFSRFREVIPKRHLKIAIGIVVATAAATPAALLFAEGYRRRAWPMAVGRIDAVEATPDGRAVTYRYKVWGRVFRKTQVNWGGEAVGRWNGTGAAYAPGDYVHVNVNVQNPTCSILAPGYCALFEGVLDRDHVGALVEIDPHWKAGDPFTALFD
jgi:hypothetical protein